MPPGDEAAKQDAPVGRTPGLGRFLPLGILLLGAALAYYFLGDYLSLQTLQENRDALIAWRDQNLVLASLGFVGIYIVAVAFSVPGAIWLTLSGGFLFGTVLAALLTIVGATIGATLIFLAARTSLGALLRAKAGPWLKRVEREVAEGEISFLLVTRLIPVIPFFVANLAPAFVNVKLWNFIWTTIVGIAPATAIISSVGAGLGEVLDQGGTPDVGVIFEPHVLLPLLGLAVLAALPVLVRKIRNRKKA